MQAESDGLDQLFCGIAWSFVRMKVGDSCGVPNAIHIRWIGRRLETTRKADHKNRTTMKLSH